MCFPCFVSDVQQTVCCWQSQAPCVLSLCFDSCELCTELICVLKLCFPCFVSDVWQTVCCWQSQAPCVLSLCFVSCELCTKLCCVLKLKECHCVGVPDMCFPLLLTESGPTCPVTVFWIVYWVVLCTKAVFHALLVTSDRLFQSQAPCVLFLEDIECLAPRQEAPGTSKDMMSRMVSELGSCIDGMYILERTFLFENVVIFVASAWSVTDKKERIKGGGGGEEEEKRLNIVCILPWLVILSISFFLILFSELHTRPENVVLIAATSKIDSVHEALRIPGRFVEKTLGIPDEKARLSILQKMCVNCTIAPDYDLKTLARHTPGFVGGDLHQLVADVLDMGFDRLCAWVGLDPFSSLSQSACLIHVFTRFIESKLCGGGGALRATLWACSVVFVSNEAVR